MHEGVAFPVNCKSDVLTGSIPESGQGFVAVVVMLHRGGILFLDFKTWVMMRLHNRGEMYG